MNKLTSIFASVSASKNTNLLSSNDNDDDENESDDEFEIEYQSKIEFLKTLNRLDEIVFEDYSIQIFKMNG